MMFRSWGRRWLVAAFGVSLVAAVVPAVGIEDPEVPRLAVKVRNMSSPGQLWYSASFQIVRRLDRIMGLMEANTMPDAEVGVCAAYIQGPGQFGASGGYSFGEPSRNGSRDSVTFLDLSGPERVSYGSPEGRAGSPVGYAEYDRRSLGWIYPAEVGVYNVLLSCASDGPVSDTHVEVTTDPGVRVLAESWGWGRQFAVNDAGFEDGVRVSAGVGEDPYDMCGYCSYVSGQGTVQAARVVRHRFRRAANAWFMSGFTFVPLAFSSSVMRIEGPGYAQGNLDGEMIGQDGRNWGTRWMSMIGQPSGEYEFGLDAHAGGSALALVPGQNRSVWAGQSSVVGLMLVDADMPACSTAPVAWRAKDGHPICRVLSKTPILKK